jgi:hypothetical protein
MFGAAASQLHEEKGGERSVGVLQHFPERRAIARTRIDRGALLFFAGRSGMFECHVRDATMHGAGLRLNGLNTIPERFDLSLDFGVLCNCQIVWRDGDHIGVRFRADLRRARS